MLFNKTKRLITVFFMLLLLCGLLSGCKKSKEDNKAQLDANEEQINSEDVAGDTEDKKLSYDGDLSEREIVFIGDSLTQGSLGSDGDNLDNSPAKILSRISGHKVEEYGFYGYNTHDIFWVYRDETQKNQTVDSKKVYIFWVGSNDFVVDKIPNCDASLVIEEIDKIINAGELYDYLVLGTTARIELRVDNEEGVKMYDAVNRQFEEHYKEHYLDVLDIITDKGYGPDSIHLTMDAYERVANAVYDRLINLQYIE